MQFTLHFEMMRCSFLHLNDQNLRIMLKLYSCFTLTYLLSPSSNQCGPIMVFEFRTHHTITLEECKSRCNTSYDSAVP